MDRFVDCERCGQRFSGEEAIRAYIRMVESPAVKVGGVEVSEVVDLCIDCAGSKDLDSFWEARAAEALRGARKGK